MISAERRSEVKKPLSLTNISGCNVSLRLQTSIVLKGAKLYFSLPSSRISPQF